MKHQLQQIREAMESADEYQAENYRDYEGPRPAIAKALTALSELERMVGEPVAWKHDCAALLANDVELWIDNCPHCGRPRAAPPAQQPQYEAGDMASAHNDGFRAGVASVARQPQARPDFNDEWTGYLKDGETPFERFMRERKDLNALTKLYQRALEENERLKDQQPQAEAVPPANCRQRLAREGKLHPRSSCAECGPLSPKWQKCNLALALEGDKK